MNLLLMRPIKIKTAMFVIILILLSVFRESFCYASLHTVGNEQFILKDCTTEKDIKSTYEVMYQLRPEYTDPNLYVKFVQHLMLNENYKLTALYTLDSGENCVGVIGYQIKERLYPGKFMYIADIVVDSKMRNKGLGSILINYVEKQALEIPGVKAVILESAINRKQTHKFYQKRGYEIKSFSFRLFYNTVQK